MYVDAMGGAYGIHGENRNVYMDLIGKLIGRRPLSNPRHCWEHNIKMAITEI
jgi:hypothetical protein